MIRNFTVLLFFLLFCISIGFAKDVKINKKASSLAKKKYCSVNEMIQEPAQPIFPIDENNIVPTSVNNVITATRTTDYAYHMLIDSCRNGFGWLKPSLHSIDRSVDANFLILCYRHYNLSNPASGIIGATEIDLSSGLEGADVFSITNLNDDLGPFPPDEHWKSIGGRFPGAVALDKPIFSFNQYFSGDAETTPAVSSPYLVTDYGTYGYSGGAWTSTLKMDEGYTHQGFSENRLWQNAVSVVKGSDAKYHYLGAYRNWTIDGESQAAEYVFLTADADDPSYWNINTNPALIDTFDYLIYPAVSMNSNGFGAAVGLGHAGNDPDNSFYMSELRPMVMFTSNYGLTWTHQREVSWEELDIPETISFSDSIWVPESVGDTNYVLYEGDAYVAIPNNHGLDVLVSENNDIYFAFDLSWGPWANEEQTTYYRDYRHCGVHVAASYNEGVSFKANHVAICNGFFEGDSSSDEAEDNFFLDSEAELALDDQGALYVAWLDRPCGKNIEVAEKMRYNYTNEELLLKADIFTSRSL
ncbi:MAG: hypothetical protein K8R79_01660, partial [Calditrichales bacterium]|nr:hypothetical protein [Calditrichales bacterium]